MADINIAYNLLHESQQIEIEELKEFYKLKCEEYRKKCDELYKVNKLYEDACEEIDMLIRDNDELSNVSTAIS